MYISIFNVTTFRAETFDIGTNVCVSILSAYKKVTMPQSELLRSFLAS